MRRRLLIAAAAMVAATPVMAQSLIGTALANGQIGERDDGYLGIIGAPSDAVKRAVNGINITRRSLYSDLAAKKGVTPEEVGLTAACTTLSRVAVGQFYFTQSKGWQRRNAGQTVALPPYCGA